jgi:hypothetical protein
MTARPAPPDPASRPPAHRDDGAADLQNPGHLVCAYSPRWLSGPSHYEGLVATLPDPESEPELTREARHS